LKLNRNDWRCPERSGAWVLAAVLSWGLEGCEDDTIVARTRLDLPINRPPLVVRLDPTLDSGAIDTQDSVVFSFSVHAGDPDGVDDVVAGRIRIESQRITDVIVRPGIEVGPGCLGPSYADGDTIDVSRWTSTEPWSPGESFLGRWSDRPIFTGAIEIPSPDHLGPVFGGSVFSCLARDAIPVGLYPPAVVGPTQAFITRMVVEYQGVEVTVFDASGATATASYPDLTVRFETEREAGTLP
jgi:hypothetical protein